MSISKALFLGVAGSVLLAGGAMAADPMPVVVAAMPAATPPVTGREVVIDVTAGFFLGVDGGGIYERNDLGGLVQVTSSSGWGARLDGWASLWLAPDVGGQAYGNVTVFRNLGNLELGVWAGAYGYFPMGGGDYGFGLSANYDYRGPRLYISSENALQLWPDFGLSSYTQAAFDLNDRVTLSGEFGLSSIGHWYGGVGVDAHVTNRLEVWGNLRYGASAGIFALGEFELGAEFNLTDRFSVWTELDVDLAPLEFEWLDLGATLELNDQLSIKGVLSFDDSPFHLDYTEVWAELDRPLGTGALSLIGEAGVGFDWDDGAYGWLSLGLRYKLGGPEDPEDNRLFGTGGPV